MDQVPFGSSNLKVSRMAFGTGSEGWRGHSKQTRLGLDGLASLLHLAYDHGVTFWDTADDYGSHPHVAHALRGLPRAQVQVLTKTMARQPDRLTMDVDRFLKELNTPYLDCVLLHCMSRSDWTTKYLGTLEALTRIKEQGKVRLVGASIHSFSALKAAVESSWADVVMVRINPKGVNMDASPAKVVPLLKQLHEQGKVVFGMKLFGCGELVDQRRAMIQYVMDLGTVNAFSIGMSSKQEILENVRLVEEVLLKPHDTSSPILPAS
jgi:aryl-alcohol dehydrogenase-like predicted oxidoreductase